MKKILAIALVCMMIAAMLVIPASAAQSNVDVTALKFAEKPTLDGIISEEEWGSVTVEVFGNQASTKEDAENGVNEYNTYMEAEDEYVIEDMSYKLWLRYDAEYFYVAVKVHDADGFAATRGGDDIWNNDCVQMRIDPQGPNSVMTKDDANYDYKTTEYDFAKYNFKDNGSRAWLNATSLINAGFALLNGENPQAYDMESDQIMDTTIFKATTVDTGDGEDDFSCETSYEIAIPWDVIGAKTMGDDWTGKEGDVLGMTLVVLNSNGGGYNAFLTWGSGICGGQAKEARATCGGSNAVTLAADTYTPAAGYETKGEEVTETEEVTEAAPVTDKADDTAEDTAEDTKANSENKPNYNDVDTSSGLPVGAIIGIIAGCVVVVGVIVGIIVSKKKKK